jgi:hypothetical protein
MKNFSRFGALLVAGILVGAPMVPAEGIPQPMYVYKQSLAVSSGSGHGLDAACIDLGAALPTGENHFSPLFYESDVVVQRISEGGSNNGKEDLKLFGLSEADSPFSIVGKDSTFELTLSGKMRSVPLAPDRYRISMLHGMLMASGDYPMRERLATLIQENRPALDRIDSAHAEAVRSKDDLARETFLALAQKLIFWQTGRCGTQILDRNIELLENVAGNPELAGYWRSVLDAGQLLNFSHASSPNPNRLLLDWLDTIGPLANVKSAPSPRKVYKDSEFVSAAFEGKNLILRGPLTPPINVTKLISELDTLEDSINTVDSEIAQLQTRCKGMWQDEIEGVKRLETLKLDVSNTSRMSIIFDACCSLNWMEDGGIEISAGLKAFLESFREFCKAPARWILDHPFGSFSLGSSSLLVDIKGLTSEQLRHACSTLAVFERVTGTRIVLQMRNDSRERYQTLKEGVEDEGNVALVADESLLKVEGVSEALVNLLFAEFRKLETTHAGPGSKFRVLTAHNETHNEQKSPEEVWTGWAERFTTKEFKDCHVIFPMCAFTDFEKNRKLAQILLDPTKGHAASVVMANDQIDLTALCLALHVITIDDEDTSTPLEILRSAYAKALENLIECAPENTLDEKAFNKLA